MEFTPEELNRLRQWYNALDDLAPNYLDLADQALAIKIVEAMTSADKRSAR